MFKAIRNLVRQRSRDGHQGQPQVIEEDDSREPRSDFDVPPRLAEPELEGSSGLAVRAQVKWFNPNKGYGFVQLSDGSGDAFLHVTALAGIGVSTLQPGVTIEFRTAPAQRGVDGSHKRRLQHRSPAQTAPKEFKIAIRPTALGGQRPRDGDGEVVQRRQGVRFHRSGRRREGRLRARLRARPGGDHGFERGPARLCRRSRGAKRTRSRLDPIGLVDPR